MPKNDRGQCLVCDDVSIGMNFGAPTCMPCKAFFRRNAVRLGVQPYVCQSDGHCSITYTDRRLCPCCRLAKCFRVGMKKSLILSDEEREARNKLIKANRLKRGKVTNRQCNDRMQLLTLLPVLSKSFEYLSSSDQVVLTNIFHIYENNCIVARNNYFPSFPVIPHSSLHEFTNEFSLIFPHLIKYFQYIPEFANIVMDDKIRLIKYHFGIIININEPLLYPVTSSNLIKSWTTIFGDDITAYVLKRNQIIEQYTVDPILLKLLIIILMLSSGNTRNFESTDLDQICDDTLSIFIAQNIYVELLWRYILSRSSTERDSVKFLNKLIMFILYIQKADMTINAFINNFKNEVKQVGPVMRCLWIDTDDEKVDNETDISTTTT